MSEHTSNPLNLYGIADSEGQNQHSNGGWDTDSAGTSTSDNSSSQSSSVSSLTGANLGLRRRGVAPRQTFAAEAASAAHPNEVFDHGDDVVVVEGGGDMARQYDHDGGLTVVSTNSADVVRVEIPPDSASAEGKQHQQQHQQQQYEAPRVVASSTSIAAAAASAGGPEEPTGSPLGRKNTGDLPGESRRQQHRHHDHHRPGSRISNSSSSTAGKPSPKFSFAKAQHSPSSSDHTHNPNTADLEGVETFHSGTLSDLVKFEPLRFEDTAGYGLKKNSSRNWGRKSPREGSLRSASDESNNNPLFLRTRSTMAPNPADSTSPKSTSSSSRSNKTSSLPLASLFYAVVLVVAVVCLILFVAAGFFSAAQGRSEISSSVSVSGSPSGQGIAMDLIDFLIGPWSRHSTISSSSSSSSDFEFLSRHLETSPERMCGRNRSLVTSRGEAIAWAALSTSSLHSLLSSVLRFQNLHCSVVGHAEKKWNWTAFDGGMYQVAGMLRVDNITKSTPSSSTTITGYQNRPTSISVVQQSVGTTTQQQQQATVRLSSALFAIYSTTTTTTTARDPTSHCTGVYDITMAQQQQLQQEEEEEDIVDALRLSNSSGEARQIATASLAVANDLFVISKRRDISSFISQTTTSVFDTWVASAVATSTQCAFAFRDGQSCELTTSHHLLGKLVLNAALVSPSVFSSSSPSVFVVSVSSLRESTISDDLHHAKLLAAHNDVRSTPQWAINSVFFAFVVVAIGVSISIAIAWNISTSLVAALHEQNCLHKKAISTWNATATATATAATTTRDGTTTASRLTIAGTENNNKSFWGRLCVRELVVLDEQSQQMVLAMEMYRSYVPEAVLLMNSELATVVGVGVEHSLHDGFSYAKRNSGGSNGTASNGSGGKQFITVAASPPPPGSGGGSVDQVPAGSFGSAAFDVLSLGQGNEEQDNDDPFDKFRTQSFQYEATGFAALHHFEKDAVSSQGGSDAHHPKAGSHNSSPRSGTPGQHHHFVGSPPLTQLRLGGKETPDLTHLGGMSTTLHTGDIVEAAVEEIIKMRTQFIAKRVSVVYCHVVYPDNFFDGTDSKAGYVVEQVLESFIAIATSCAKQFDGVTYNITADGIYIYWNAFKPFPFHEQRAVLCALHIASELHTLEEDILVRMHNVKWCICVNSGFVVMGTTEAGHTMRTIIEGDCVSYCHLVACLGAHLQSQLVCLEPTYNIAKSHVFCIPVDVIGTVTGVRMKVFEIKNKLDNAAGPQSNDDRYELYREGFSHFLMHKYSDAAECFLKLRLFEHQAQRLARYCVDAMNNEVTQEYVRMMPHWQSHEDDYRDQRLSDDIRPVLEAQCPELFFVGLGEQRQGSSRFRSFRVAEDLENEVLEATAFDALAELERVTSPSDPAIMHDQQRLRELKLQFQEFEKEMLPGAGSHEQQQPQQQQQELRKNSDSAATASSGPNDDTTTTTNMSPQSTKTQPPHSQRGRDSYTDLAPGFHFGRSLSPVTEDASPFSAVDRAAEAVESDGGPVVMGITLDPTALSRTVSQDVCTSTAQSDTTGTMSPMLSTTRDDNSGSIIEIVGTARGGRVAEPVSPGRAMLAAGIMFGAAGSGVFDKSADSTDIDIVSKPARGTAGTAVTGTGAASTRYTKVKDKFGNEWRVSDKKLGEGTFGSVFLGLHQNGSLAAVKCLEIPQFAPAPPTFDDSDNSSVDSFNSSVSSADSNASRRNSIMAATNHDTTRKVVGEVLNEVGFLSQFRSEHVVGYISSAVVGTNMYIFMEYISGGTLSRLLRCFGALPNLSLQRYARDILLGLQFLHERKIVHRDISPNNILLSIEGECKITDFGASTTSSRLQAAGSNNIFGTPAYMAPESARGEPSSASDIWSFGVMMCELTDGRLPFDECDMQEAQFFVNKVGYDDTFYPHIPLCVLEQDALRALVQSCLRRDPSERPSAADLLHSRFFM